ncbi:MAG: sulfotransferase [Phycisphaerales bacterium]|nr:sulfotransferase [Phycisphaerales bacterium]
MAPKPGSIRHAIAGIRITHMTRLAYILAASHSGSTLLAMLLNAHPDICTAGELKMTNLGDIDRYRCSCGALIRECGFWEKVREGMARHGFAFDLERPGTNFNCVGSGYARRLLRPLHRGPCGEALRDTVLALSGAWRRSLPEMLARNAALAETVCEIRGAKLIVDSSKVGVRLKYLLRSPELDVRVIRLVRDGRAVAMTYLNPALFADARDPEKRGGGSGGDRRDERLSMRHAAVEWLRSNEEAEHILARLDRSRWTQVRYEDFCRSPAETLGRLFTFLGVDAGLAKQDFRKAEHHVLGNGMRLDTTSEIALDERWKSVLTTEDLRVFEQIAGRMKRQYGYG